VWAGVDSAWKQEKPEARKMLKNAASREAAVPHIGCTFYWAVFGQNATMLFYLPPFHFYKLQMAQWHNFKG